MPRILILIWRERNDASRLSHRRLHSPVAPLKGVWLCRHSGRQLAKSFVFLTLSFKFDPEKHDKSPKNFRDFMKS